MSADSEQCRKVWAALEKYPGLKVTRVLIDSATYRWACWVVVPWDRYAKIAGTMADVERLTYQLEKWEAEERAAAEAAKIQAADVVLASSMVVAQYKSGEKQLGLFSD